MPDGAQVLTPPGRPLAAARPPSGEQVELELGEQRAVVVEVGGGIRSYSVGGRELLDAYDADARATSGRGQVLVPWPNRLQDGRYDFGGERHQLPLTEPEHGNAIHGLVRWVPWRIAERDAHRVVVRHVVPAQPGYPFTLGLAVEYTLSRRGLAVRTTATNLGVAPCPYGAGAHPYLRLGTPTVNTLLLRVPAQSVVLADARGLPTATGPVDGTKYDFRSERTIGTTRLDNAFTDLDRDERGIAYVVLREPTGGGLALWADESYPYLQLFTGDPLPDVNRRSIAVEPMTCLPNAFRTGDDVVVLEPGGSTTGTWGIEPREDA